MNEFLISFLHDLKTIDNLLINCNDVNKGEILEHDKNMLLSFIDKEHAQIRNLPKFNISKAELSSIVICNQINGVFMNNILNIKFNNPGLNKNIFNEFMYETEFGLLFVYKRIISYNGLYLLDRKESKSNKSLGQTLYIQSLDKNYISVNFNNKLKDYSTLIHELGHAKQNIICGENKSNSYISDFGEVYSLFLELQFSDYLKKFDLEKESFNLKNKFFADTSMFFDILYEQLDQYNNMNINTKKYFYLIFKESISSLVAIYLYNIYKEDKKTALNMLERFEKNYNRVDDGKLLSSIGLSYNNLKDNEILHNFMNKLKSEKYMIKRKL